MSSKIRVLSDDTINKIAAGEVIENPASVVKELVENALDAAATEITIEIREGGRQLIRITDNGCGMNADDALLCLERHATSKLKSVDDIEEIATMGFRGEAIPSIASISKFTLFSRPNDKNLADQPGTMVIVDGGKIVKCCPVECSMGTTIEVKALFFNVPVRKKFQKSPAYDSAEICRIVSLLALANPEVKFQLIGNQETLLLAPVYPKESFQALLDERIQQTLGLEFSKHLCPLNGTKGEYSLQGFLGLPTSAKQNRTGQYLFINRRAVASPLVSYAIRDGYGTMLGTGRHPLYVLHLTIPGHLLDVNVHPQKREVRLRQEHLLKELIIKAVGDALRHEEFAPMELPTVTVPNFFPPRESLEAEEPRFQPFPSFAFGSPNTDFDLEAPVVPYRPANAWPRPSEQIAVPDAPMQAQLFTPEPVKKAIPKVLATIPRYILATPPESGISQSSPILCLIDQRAAHERIIYDKIAAQSGHNVEMQVLLIPHTFDLAPAEASFLRERIAPLQQMGLQIKEFGSHTFVIDALPQLFGNVDIHRLIEEILCHLHYCEGAAVLELEIKKKIALAASRAAISGERILQQAEAEQLLEQLFSCSQPDLCPSGKPTMLHLSSQQLAAWFKNSGKSNL